MKKFLIASLIATLLLCACGCNRTNNKPANNKILIATDLKNG